jgi:molecular chaperone GrpE
VSRRKHQKQNAGPDEAAEPNPNPEADEGALWSEAAETTGGASPEVGAGAPPAGASDGAIYAPPATPDEPASEVERLKAQAAEYLDGWQRARAEFANYKKRIERDQEETRARVVADLLQDFVTVLDDLERALRDRPTEGEASAWASGIDMIQRKLMAVLDAEGVRPFLPAPGDAFDPNVHEAVSHEASSDHTEDQIIDVIHQGYRVGERVIRPALVRVAK